MATGGYTRTTVFAQKSYEWSLLGHIAQTELTLSAVRTARPSKGPKQLSSYSPSIGGVVSMPLPPLPHLGCLFSLHYRCVTVFECVGLFCALRRTLRSTSVAHFKHQIVHSPASLRCYTSLVLYLACAVPSGIICAHTLDVRQTYMICLACLRSNLI